MKKKVFWIFVGLMSLLMGLVIASEPEVPVVDYLRFDDLDQFVVHWAGRLNPGETGSFTLTGAPGPLICRGIPDETDCDCHIEKDKKEFWIDCYFNSAIRFKIPNRPCKCLVSLWWEDDAGFHHLGNYTGQCLECTFLPNIRKGNEDN